MARKHYSEEFRQQAVDLYESTPGATVRGIAEDLGIVRGTLRQWLETHGTGKKTAADGTLTDSPLRSAPIAPTSDPREPLEQRVARLEAENAQLRAGDDEAHHGAGDPPEGREVFRRGDALVSRFQFVADHSTTYPVKRLCELVEIERSSYYAWQTGAPARSAREESDGELLKRIRIIHAEDDAQGAPRITAELNDGAAPEDRVQPQAGRSRDARGRPQRLRQEA